MFVKASPEMQERTPFTLAFMTDLRRLPNQIDILTALPLGTAVIFRDYDHPTRLSLARTYRDLCGRYGLKFIVADDAHMAKAVDADGVHLPSYRLSRPQKNGIKGYLSCACHTADDLKYAAQLGADIAFLSPVFRTASHPEKASLGVAAFKKIADHAKLPILALGGITSENVSELGHGNVVGIGAIGAFSPR